MKIKVFAAKAPPPKPGAKKIIAAVDDEDEFIVKPPPKPPEPERRKSKEAANEDEGVAGYARSFDTVTLKELDEDKVYGVLTQPHRQFGSVFRPAMGSEIVRHARNAQDFGVVRFFGRERCPKGAMLVQMPDSHGLPVFIAVREWEGDYTPEPLPKSPVRLHVRPKKLLVKVASKKEIARVGAVRVTPPKATKKIKVRIR